MIPERSQSALLPVMVSVIMPAYNGEDYIAESIRSVLNQSWSNLELIVIDDGSVDRTPEIVEQLQAQDFRVKSFRQENAGQAAARNRGIAKASGDLIAFLDQDDLWLAHKLEVQIAALQNTAVDIVFSNGYVFSEQLLQSEMGSFPEAAGKFSGPEMFRLLFRENRIPILTALVRKKSLIEVDLLAEDPRYQNADDYDLWLRLAASGASFLGLGDKLVKYREHPNQASSDVVKMLKAELAVLKDHENATLVSDKDKAKRFRLIYQRLIRSLLDEGKVSEARTYFKELLRRKARRPGVLAQAPLLWLAPRHHNQTLDFVHRIRESVAYRLGRPLRSLWKSIFVRSEMRAHLS